MIKNPFFPNAYIDKKGSCPLPIIGSLRLKVQEWLGMSVKKPSTSDCLQTNLKLLESLIGYQRKLISSCHAIDIFVNYDDEDLDSWEAEAKRWTRVLFLVIKEEEDLNPIFKVCFFFAS